MENLKIYCSKKVLIRVILYLRNRNKNEIMPNELNLFVMNLFEHEAIEDRN